MKFMVTKLVGFVFAFMWPLISWADAPLGVGSADVESGSCMGEIVVGPDGDFLPFLDGVHGVLIIELGQAKAVFANSANGNINLTCHGNVAPGDIVAGIDAATQLPAWGTVAERHDACSAIFAFGLPNPCRGKGEKSAIIIDRDFRGQQCNINGVLTDNWKSVFNSGGYMLTCHSKD